MSTFTKLYLTGRTPIYVPTTLRGAWDKTAGAVTKVLAPQKAISSSDDITIITIAETSATSPYDVLLYRGVSGPLAAQTISGNLDVIISATSTTTGYFNWHIHAYVTQGDSDTPRGVLINDYIEADGVNTWGNSGATGGKALDTAQALNLAVQEGDRIVVELGYTARNTTSLSKAGFIRYGNTLDYNVVDDLTVGGNGTELAGFISFSATITESDETDVRITQSPLRVMRDATDTAVRLTQAPLRILRDGDINSVRVTQTHIRVLYAPEYDSSSSSSS